MDTASSLAIAWIENLSSVLEAWKRNGVIRDREGYLQRFLSLLKEAKFSYLEPGEIEERYVGRMAELLKKLLATPMDEVRRRFTSYVLEEVEDLPRKLRLNPAEPFQVFRYRFVTVVSVSDHPTLELKVTRTRDRFGVERTVVTNVKDVKEGKEALIVLLPPREFDGVWSEGMYVKFDVEKPEDITVDDLKPLNSYFVVKP